MSKRKKIIIIVLSIVSLFLILFTPIPKTTPFADGSALSLTSLTYKVIFWDMYENSEKPYDKTETLLLPNNFKSTQALWDSRCDKLTNEGYGSVIMYASITQKDEMGITVKETITNPNDTSASVCYIDKDTFDKVSNGVTYSELSLGRTLVIVYDGMILEVYPSLFNNIFKITISDVETTVVKDKSDSATETIKDDIQSNTQRENTTKSSTNSSSVQSRPSDTSSYETTSSQNSSIIQTQEIEKPKRFWFQNIHKFPEHYDQQVQLLMPYIVVEPQDYDPTKKYPVILYFHGKGDGYPEKDDLEYAKKFNQQQAYQFADLYSECYEWLDQAIIIMPQLQNGLWWSFYPEEDGPLDAAMRIFDKVTSDFSCDSSRYYVMGPSMGGFATIEVAAKYSDTFAAAMPLCAAYLFDENTAKKLTDIPMFFLHGTADYTVPADYSEQNCNLIKAAGGEKATYKLYDGADHDLWRYALKDDEPFEWLFAQKKQ